MSDENLNEIEMQDFDSWDEIDESIPESNESVEEVENEEQDYNNIEEPKEEVKEEANKSDDNEAKQDNSEVEDDKKQATQETLSIDKLSDDDKIRVKVDGEEQEISIKEFKNGISGQKAIDKRFSEFDKKEKEFKSQMENVNNYINSLGETMSKEGMLSGLQKIGELVGLKPSAIQQGILEEVYPLLQKYQSMSEEQRKFELDKMDFEHDKKQSEVESSKYAQEQARLELERNIHQMKLSHNINDEEWEKAFSELDAQLPKDEAITPDMVKERSIENRISGRADNLLTEVDGNEFNLEEFKPYMLNFIKENPDLSDDEVRVVLNDALRMIKKEEKEAEFEPKVEQKKQTNKQVPTTDDEDIEDWDDLI